MTPRIETLNEKKLIGKKMAMSLAVNKTGELWGSFMPRRKDISNKISSDLYAVQLYDPSYFKNFNVQNEFTKWATLEVSNFDTIPDGLETLILPGGLYAVFLHQGPASAGPKTFQYIFGTWIPNSIYAPDDRPHFEILGEKYKNEDPSSEEEIWIPIRLKN
jgi:AraC family transcriptional regulator